MSVVARANKLRKRVASSKGSSRESGSSKGSGSNKGSGRKMKADDNLVALVC